MSEAALRYRSEPWHPDSVLSEAEVDLLVEEYFSEPLFGMLIPTRTECARCGHHRNAHSSFTGRCQRMCKVDEPGGVSKRQCRCSHWSRPWEQDGAAGGPSG